MSSNAQFELVHLIEKATLKFNLDPKILLQVLQIIFLFITEICSYQEYVLLVILRIDLKKHEIKKTRNLQTSNSFMQSIFNLWKKLTDVDAGKYIYRRGRSCKTEPSFPQKNSWWINSKIPVHLHFVQWNSAIYSCYIEVKIKM